MKNEREIREKQRENEESPRDSDFDNVLYHQRKMFYSWVLEQSEDQEKCDHFVYAEIDCFSFGPIVQIGKQDPESEIEFVHGVHFKFCPNCGKKLESE